MKKYAVSGIFTKWNRTGGSNVQMMLQVMAASSEDEAVGRFIRNSMDALEGYIMESHLILEV